MKQKRKPAKAGNGNTFKPARAAGNTGVRNELVSVCDELLRQKLIDKHKYKIIMLQL